MKVILAIDDSVQSQAALTAVTEMRWPLDARFVILSAVAQPSYALAEPAGAIAYEEIQKERFHEHAELVAEAEQRLERAGLPVTGRVARGDPREAIVEAALAERADLVVVGSSGHTGLSRLLLGSVASHVVTHAPCNVLVVKPSRSGEPLTD